MNAQTARMFSSGGTLRLLMPDEISQTVLLRRGLAVAPGSRSRSAELSRAVFNPFAACFHQKPPTITTRPRAEFSEAARELDQIRRIVAINLVLGLLTVIVGASGRFW
jgi:hypothetical protein